MPVTLGQTRCGGLDDEPQARDESPNPTRSQAAATKRSDEGRRHAVAVGPFAQIGNLLSLQGGSGRRERVACDQAQPLDFGGGL